MPVARHLDNPASMADSQGVVPKKSTPELQAYHLGLNQGPTVTWWGDLVQ
jgi:hypothetical protein